ncbi:uncharacterized protein LOC127115849 [Lathyrus oleraceus]|uniref:Senescence regulator n=1 Tax=Pisum sativum TaxID=3888 RepID=A0A9D5GZM7_PEA|nr:uncharacterized protein LOC127115849 [Pisum sativum]KAI5447210.1 hypothetical protein KIW84_014892 [Pisum sativum]
MTMEKMSDLSHYKTTVSLGGNVSVLSIYICSNRKLYFHHYSLLSSVFSQPLSFISMADWAVLNKREDQDFDEEHVWGDYTSNIKRVSKDKDSGSSAWTLPRKNIPKGNALVVSDEPKGSSSSSSAAAAPINIPDWSKVYGKKNCKKGGLHGYEDEDEEDEEGDMVPPHEWIARKLARSQISSFSVCEGMGRTLKGRDLSKVRNAILTKTGFIE